jgi:hypothetical protein
MSYVLAGLLQGLFWLITLSVALWLCRKIAPSLEVALFKVNFVRGIGIIGRKCLARLRGFQAEPPAPSKPAPTESGRGESL